MDETFPQIIAVGWKNGANLAAAKRIVLTVKDNLEKFRDFRAELDGRWLRFTNDKGRSFIYTFDEHCPPGLHELKVSVSDEAGNRTEQRFVFTR